MTVMVSRFRCIVTVVLLLAGGGCSTAPQMDYSSIELINVTGTVTLDGAPLTSTVVTFEDPLNSTFSFAMTDQSGHYELQLDSQKSGVTPGKKNVQFSTMRKILGLNTDEEGAAPNEGGAGERVPACYNKQSELSVEVTASTTAFDFDLKSDCSTTGAK